jgi:hypothetical protein
MACQRSSSSPLFLRLQPDLDLAERPTIQAMPPAVAKNTTAIEASESGSLFVTIAAKIVGAANPDMIAIVRPHR